MSTIKLFENQQVRSVWDQDKETWYFSIIDVVAVLTDSADAAAYWRKLKQRLKAEGNQTVTNCHGLKMTAPDGKMRLTDEWEQRGVQKGQEFAILTDEITKAWSGLSTREYKQVKGLKKEGLRDNMTNLELVLNMLAEATTTEISKEKLPTGFEQNRKIAKQGGTRHGESQRRARGG
jgi:hypothetical protein